MNPSNTASSGRGHIAQQLLSRAYSPDTASELFTEKVKQKPLFLHPTSSTPADNRSRRRLHRLRKKEYFLRKQKPKPLSAREKRTSGIYDLSKEEIRYGIFKGLHNMWVEYMHDVLDMKRNSSQNYINPLVHGSQLASADFHGAELEIVRSRCVSRVGVKGIVVRDSKFTFVVVTEKDEVKTIPKEHTVFRFEIPPPRSENTETNVNKKNLTFELHGSQFENRSVDRANKKFKWRNLDYL
ncbi:hypothetical protein AJ79_10156 [Helicocarpus griseus UAMH5409]|uniref:Ribonuclease P protein subunit n=1 Tax=Helicocarpus griseus UAMH5409 TaxID=1447875 RepID=A0A2B7WFD3_9EURO|nr:hypothetical protein AJ79_10156 [Helicocarpus griseus UAMH5409]